MVSSAMCADSEDVIWEKGKNYLLENGSPRASEVLLPGRGPGGERWGTVFVQITSRGLLADDAPLAACSRENLV